MKITKILIIILLVFFLTRPTLLLENREGEILLLMPILWNGNFSTFYIHSVEKTPVLEYFQVKGRTIHLWKTVFSSYGAGLPLDWNGFQQQGNTFVIQELNRSFSHIYYRVSGTKDQYLKVNNRMIFFHSLFLEGERVTLRALPLYSFIYDTIMNNVWRE